MQVSRYQPKFNHRSRRAVARKGNKLPSLPRRARHGAPTPLLILAARCSQSSTLCRLLWVPWSTVTSASRTPCSHTVSLHLSLTPIPPSPLSTPPSLWHAPSPHLLHLGVFIQTCASISHLCFCNGEMIGCVVCKVTATKLASHQRLWFLMPLPSARKP